MPALDTNILVRFLVQDDAAQLVATQRLIAKAVVQGQTLFVPVTVTLELEWMLRSSYARPKDRAWRQSVGRSPRRKRQATAPVFGGPDLVAQVDATTLTPVRARPRPRAPSRALRLFPSRRLTTIDSPRDHLAHEH